MPSLPSRFRFFRQFLHPSEVLIGLFIRLGFPRRGSARHELDAESLYRIVRNALLFGIAGGCAALAERCLEWLSGQPWNLAGIILTVFLASLGDGLRRWQTDYSRLMDLDLEDQVSREGADSGHP